MGTDLEQKRKETSRYANDFHESATLQLRTDRHLEMWPKSEGIEMTSKKASRR